MTYKDALASERKTGISRAQGEAALAGMVHSLTARHGGLNPSMVFEGAKKRGLSWTDFAKLAAKDEHELSNLMFEGMGI